MGVIMTKRAFFRFGIISLVLFILSCTPPVSTPPDIGSTPIQTTYAGYFTVGVATTPSKLNAAQNIVDFHFNRIACENDMKWGTIEPTDGGYNFTNADAITNYARTRGIKMTGHTLVWHSQAPSWLFSGMTAGNATDIATLKTRMQSHIQTLVNRYYDVVDNWDVVNEAISDTSGKTYRDAGENSKWYEIFGSEEYIYWAFRYAKDALEAHTLGGSAGKLYYNDYSVESPTKLNKIITLVKWLRQDAGSSPLPAGQLPIAIDGVGSQAHWQLGWPDTTTIQNTITALHDLGVEVKFSELDVSVYTSSANPQVDFTTALAQQQATRYAAIFQIFRTNAADISSVTLWGITDDQSWLNNFPTAGRNDYPLLFGRDHRRKPAYDSIVGF
jgi:endo-1,4-beta-xylanase